MQVFYIWADYIMLCIWHLLYGQAMQTEAVEKTHLHKGHHILLVITAHSANANC